jgi:integrase
MEDIELMGSDLKNDIRIIEWFDTISPKKATERNYIRSMQNFTEWIGKSPEELIIEAEKEIKAGLLPRERTIKRNLIGFRRHLHDKKLAPTTVKTYMTGVTNFYKSFDIDIPNIPRSEKRAQPLQENCEIPTKEDLQEVLKICDPMEKAILLTGASSGLSANEIINLKIKDFKKGYDPVTEITTLKLRRGKVGFDFITFLSPEASKAVYEYLKYRDRTHNTGDMRRINQIRKQNIFSENGYLLIGRTIPEEFLQTKNEELRKLEPSAFLKIYRTISEKARKSTEKGKWSIVRSHNVRKYFNSALLNAGADSFHVEFFMGHKLDDTKAAYFRANSDKLRDLYSKYIPYLTIQKEADISESPEYLRIKQENQILQAETARHVVERSEIQDLRAEMEKMKEASEAAGSIKEEYMQFADMKEILEMKNSLKQELEEISKLKETLMKAGK